VGEVFFPKVFRIFDFGHFFCPFFKTQNTFQQKAMPILHCEHKALVSIFKKKNV
jgi:hypothetical protein